MSESRIIIGHGVPINRFCNRDGNIKVSEVQFHRRRDEMARQVFLLKPKQSRMTESLMRCGKSGISGSRIYIECKIKNNGKIEKKVLYSDEQNTADKLQIFWSFDKDLRVVITVAKDNAEKWDEFKDKSPDDCLRMLGTKMGVLEIKDGQPRYYISYLYDDDILQTADFNLNGNLGALSTFDLSNNKRYIRSKPNPSNILTRPLSRDEALQVDDIYSWFIKPRIEPRQVGDIVAERHRPQEGIGVVSEGNAPLTVEEYDNAGNAINRDSARILLDRQSGPMRRLLSKYKYDPNGRG